MYWGFKNVVNFILVFSTILSLTFQSGLNLWFILELNFMCFMSVLSKSVKNKLTNSLLQYFLIQSVGSLLIFLSLMIEIWNPSKMFLLVFFGSLILKLGSVPFHWWYLKLIQNISWNMVWLLSIWQKIIPFVILTLSKFELAIFIGVVNTLLGSVGSFKQHNLKKILGLSSIFSMGWMLVSLKVNMVVWLKFILIYGLILIFVIKLLKISEFYICNSISAPVSSSLTLMFVLSLFMLGGFPPFMGFFLKLFILKTLMSCYFISSMILLMSSVLLTFSYLMMGFYSLSISLSKSLILSSKTGLTFSFWEFIIMNSIGSIIIMNMIYF